MKIAQRILAVILAAGLAGGAMAATYYVDASVGSDGNTPVQAENPGTPWASITNALIHAADGDVIEVMAGVYPAAIEIGVPLTLRGPNADIPWNGVRNPEAVLLPAAGKVMITAFRTNNVSICGFTFDGDNPAIGGGTAVNGADVNVTYGLANTAAASATTPRVHVEHFTFRNNIVKNMNTVALSFANVGEASPWNVVHGNLFTNVFFRGISGGSNCYLDIQSNNLEMIQSAIYVGGSYTLACAAGFHPTISRNTIKLQSTGRAGTYPAIWLNHWYQGMTYPITIQENIIEVGVPHPPLFCGIVVTSFTQGSAMSASNNVIRGNGAPGNGYYSWNNSVVANVQFVGGTVSGADSGVYVAWRDYIMGNYGNSYMGASCCTVDRLVLTNNAVGIVSSNSTPVVRNSLVADGRDGLSVVLGAPTFENCSVANNADAGLRRLSGTPLVRNSILWGNGTDVVGDVTPSMFSYSDIGTGGYMENHCLSVDPHFQGPGYYNLSWSSPCRNAGIVVDAWMKGALDVAGNPRIHHTKVDIGAYELQGGDASLIMLR